MSTTTTPKITGQRKRHALAAALDWVESYEGMDPDGDETLLGAALDHHGAEALLKHAHEDMRTYPEALIDAAVLLREMLAPKPPKRYSLWLVNRPLSESARVTMQAQDPRSARIGARQYAVAQWGGNLDDWKVETTERIP